MKFTLPLAILAFILSLCNLTERLTDRSRTEQGNVQSSSRNANESNGNTSANIPTENTAPPPTAAPNQNSAGAASADTVSGGLLNDRATSLPKPVYPPTAKAARASGVVVVQVTIDETGVVKSVTAVSGHPLLRQAAVQAAYQARFTPMKVSGKPVKVSGTISYNFVLE
jgi:periplasmic protein TonB